MLFCTHFRADEWNSKGSQYTLPMLISETIFPCLVNSGVPCQSALNESADHCRRSRWMMRVRWVVTANGVMMTKRAFLMMQMELRVSCHDFIIGFFWVFCNLIWYQEILYLHSTWYVSTRSQLCLPIHPGCMFNGFHPSLVCFFDRHGTQTLFALQVKWMKL